MGISKKLVQSLLFTVLIAIYMTLWARENTFQMNLVIVIALTLVSWFVSCLMFGFKGQKSQQSEG